MQIRVKEGRVYITRENYKGIKKYDRRQMEQALQAIYEKGKADGKPEVPEKVRIRQGVTLAADAVVHALEETKGIGEKRREEILQRFRDHANKKMEEIQCQD